MSVRVQSLLRRVSERDVDSAYQAPLKERLRGHRQQQTLEKEIASEIAYSLGKSGRLLRAALEALTAIEAEYQRSTDPERRRQLRKAHESQRQEASRRLRYLQIQREALGFRGHHEIARLYPIPDPLPHS